MGFWQFATGGGSGGGSGDVVGPASATDNAIARFDGTTGKLIQNSGVTVADGLTGSVVVGSTGATDDAILVADGTGGSTLAATNVFIDSSSIFRLGGANSNNYPALRPKSDNSGTFEVVRAANPVGAWGNISTEGGRISASLISISPGTSSAVTMYGSSSLLQLGTSAGIAWTDNSSAEAGSLNLSLKRSSGGVLIVGNGSTGIGRLLNAVLVEANTAGSGTPNAIAATESGTLFTNEGATAENYEALPTAAAGYQFTFIVQDADGMRIVANTDDTIRVIDKVTAAAGYIESTTIGSVVTLIAINATEWIATSIHGTWTDGTWSYDDTSLTTP